MSTDVRSPGGWLNLLNTRVGRWMVVGSLALGGGAGAIYGTFQGQQASHFMEVELEAVETADSLIAVAINPLQEGMSGAILADLESILCFEETPSPAS